MIKQSLALVAILGTLAPTVMVATPSFAQSEGQPSRGRWGDRQPGEGLSNLNLTPEQTQQMQAVRQQYQGQMEQTHNQLQTARNQMKELMNSGASESQIQAKFREVQELQNRMANLRFESMMAVRSILTPEQRQQLTTQMQQRRQQRQNAPGASRQPRSN
ncbi:Spy/CpxP family protein refolding chaperone [Candidatus Synechococcus calcipolaris G9]|uniref:Spy/CpxP family protein refolding chaperone n=1 Tax=Candidatus Synechococcus calcipolaris G9 TaxID=1497997 RepID=A0ABT6F0J6_9SYNE|nr:Spy/CpxP family protein refolding chaperone [Candidatus Synechococcus calcipolaris]MDG2991384.1 Spy/CpxP family protein refolding chaperone [Candidatus Synechococcus calcipolaris G9]